MKIDSTIKKSIKRVCSRQCIRPSLIATAVGMLSWFATFGIVSVVAVVASRHLGAPGEYVSANVLWPLIYFGRFVLVAEFLRRYFDPIYIFAAKGMAAKQGRLSMKLRSVTVRYADIREMRVEQNILGRLLCYGDVRVGTASTNNYEIDMQNVSNPHGIIQWISEEKLSKKKSQIVRTSPDTVDIVATVEKPT